MSIYKKASQQRLRILTPQGALTVEQMWDLNENDLDALAVKLEAEYKSSGRKSFLHKKTKKDSDLKLAFDLVLDILETKVTDNEQKLSDLDKKAHNNKIDALIEQKKEGALQDLSIDELMEMRK